MKRIFLTAVFFLCAAFAFAGDVEFKMISLKNVSLSADISVFRDELMLGSEPIERILVTDMTSDGFDENDMVQLYPSGRVLRLAPLTSRLDSLLRAYRLPPNVEIHESRQYFARYDSLSRERRGGQALGYGLLGGIAERIARGYRGESVEGYFKNGPSGCSILAWNFDSTKVGFPPAEAPRSDTVRIFIHDTVYVPEVITIRPDPVVIHDTILIPAELMKDIRGMYYRNALGMFGGGYRGAHRESSRGRLALGAGNEWDFGVWDPWISGRQDIRARIGSRFMAEMAPWRNDTLSPRFLGTSFEMMFIPAWDRNFFFFGGIRAIYHDNLFWDRTRAAWDEDLYTENAVQDLSQYEMTVKFGLDKFASYGTGKRMGAWLKLSGSFSGGRKSGYDLKLKPSLAKQVGVDVLEEMPWRWESSGGVDCEAAMTARLSESAQLMISLGEQMLTQAHYQWQTDSVAIPQSGEGNLDLLQFYQTVSMRFAVYNHKETRLLFEGRFRNNTLQTTVKVKSDEALLKKLFFPYMETPEFGLFAQLDISVIRLRAGAEYFLPPQGHDAQLRPEVGLQLMVR